MLFFNIHGSVDRNNILIQKSQQDAHVTNPDDWLTVHRSTTLVDFQLDAQNSLFIYL
jgi:hypothetical protein